MPRVANFPPYAYSEAEEVIELYERYVGRPLDPWQCLVLRHGLGRRADGEMAALKVGCWVPRQNGKGDIILALELAWLFLPGLQVPLITHSAHLYPTAQEAFLRAKDVLDGSDELRPRIKAIREANGEQGIVMRSGQRLKFMSRTRSGGRGLSAPRIVLDEAQELQAPMMAALLPTMSAQPDAQAWMFGTPPDRAEAWVYDLRADGEAGQADLAWFDWGLAFDPTSKDDRPAIADRANWWKANPAAGIRISRRTMESEFRPSGLGAKFASERLGCWLPHAGSSGAIADDLWESLTLGEPERPDEVMFMVDVAPERDSSAIIAAGRLADGRILVSVSDHRPGTAWLAARVAQLRARWRPLLWLVDGKSPAATLVDDDELAFEVAEDLDDLKRGSLLVMDMTQAAVAWGVFVDLVRGRQVVHLGEAPMNVALAGARVRKLGDGSAWARRGGTDITPLVGATGAVWGIDRLADRVKPAEVEPGVWRISRPRRDSSILAGGRR